MSHSIDCKNIRILPAHDCDADQLARLHLEAFPNFFLTFLGQNFLVQLYRGIIADSSGAVFKAEDHSGNLCGFVAGTMNPEGLYRRLLMLHWWRFGCASALPALRRPLIIPRLIRALLLPSAQHQETLPTPALLMSLGVSPHTQGRGIGKTLVLRFVDECSRRGSKVVSLTTDQIGNDGVNAFYRSMGFKLHRRFSTPENRQMNEYRIEVPPVMTSQES